MRPAACWSPPSAAPACIPYQPPGLWEALATRNATTYTQGHGDDLHRRSLYTVWKRSSPPPSATSFDAAERLFCTVNRQRTSTPLQALILLNDPQYVEAARKLGERMVLEGGQASSDRVSVAFRLLTGRTPLPSELALLETLYADAARGVREGPRRGTAAAGHRRGAAERRVAGGGGGRGVGGGKHGDEHGRRRDEAVRSVA